MNDCYDQAFNAARGVIGMAYALWLALWHMDSRDEWGQLLQETRRPGYDGELI